MAADNVAEMIREGEYEDAEKTLRGIGEYLEHLKLWAARVAERTEEAP